MYHFNIVNKKSGVTSRSKKQMFLLSVIKLLEIKKLIAISSKLILPHKDLNKLREKCL